MTGVVDYSKGPVAALFQLLSNKNNIVLDPSQWDVSDPEVFSDPLRPNYNTVVVITPLVRSGYANSRQINYARLDFNQIFSTEPIDVSKMDLSKIVNLSDLVPYLNIQYGLNLTLDDYTDTPLPAYDPVYPNKIRQVTISAKDTSYFFVGNCTLNVGPVLTPVVDQDGIQRAYYVYCSGYSLPSSNKSLVKLNSNGIQDLSFTFLANASAITTFTVEKIIQQSNGDLAVLGNFAFNYTDATGTTTPITAKTLIINKTTGAVTGFAQTRQIKLTDQSVVYGRRGLATKYVIDATYVGTGQNAAGLYQLQNDTTLNAVYQPAITYVPAFVRLDSDGKLYTVSKPITANNPYKPTENAIYIRIDRLNTDGSLDQGFTPIYVMGSVAGQAPLNVIDLFPIQGDGGFFVMNPTSGIDASVSIIPVINNVPLFNKAQALNTTYSWNPIVKFDADGTQDTSFKAVLPSNYYPSVFQQNSDYASAPNDPDSWMLFVPGNKVNLLSYRTNPATGFMHYQPIQFDQFGVAQLGTLAAWQNAFKWTVLPKLQTQTNGDLVGFGFLQTLLSAVPGAGLSAPYSAVVRYNGDATPDRVLYRAPIANGNDNPVVAGVFITESH
jgi:hypothetical protein